MEHHGPDITVPPELLPNPNLRPLLVRALNTLRKALPLCRAPTPKLYELVESLCKTLDHIIVQLEED